MKTRAQVLEEYKARTDASEFHSVTVLEDHGCASQYTGVSGLHNTIDESGKWLEFDYESFTFGKKMHVKLHGHVVKTIVPGVEE